MKEKKVLKYSMADEKNKYIKDVEITCQVFEEITNISQTLGNTGFQFVEKFTVDDTYMCNIKSKEFVPKNGKISDTLIIRYVNENDKKIICKRRNYDNKGIEISTEKSVLRIQDIEEAEKHLNMLGYTRFLKMIHTNYMYENKEYIAYIQEIQDLGIFLELEAKNKEFTRNNLIEYIKKLKLKTSTEFNIRKAELLYTICYNVID